MIWTRDANIAAQGALPLSFIGIAVAFNSVFNIIFLHMVKRSAFRVLIACYCSAGTIIILTIPEFAKTYGIMAGGLSWLVFCSTQLFFGVWWWLREKSTLRGLV